jgi:hypothetical protein
MTGHHHDDVLDARPNGFDKLGRSAGADTLRKVAELRKNVSRVVAESSALAKRIDRMEGQFTEIAEIIKRVEINAAVVERDALAAQAIHKAVYADRPFGPVDLERAIAERSRGAFFMN